MQRFATNDCMNYITTYSPYSLLLLICIEANPVKSRGEVLRKINGIVIYFLNKVIIFFLA
jgi:hypothetical protein